MDIVLSLSSGIAAVVVGVLGIIVTTHEQFVVRNRNKIVAAFVVFGLIPIVVDVVQSLQSRKQERLAQEAEARRDVLSARLDSTMSDLSVKSAAETDALRKMNDAQAETKKVTDENRKLAGETLQQVIGDPTHPPYLQFTDFNLKVSPPTARAYLVNSSKRYAARAASITMSINSQRYSSLAQDISPSFGASKSRGPIEFFGGGLADDRLVNISGLEIGKVVYFPVSINTAIGTYTQRTAIVRTSEDTVLQGLKVFGADAKIHLVHEQDDGFPEGQEFRLEMTN
jgi:hypothetical protein